MEKTYNISEASRVIGVSVKTLQRWDREGKLVAKRTPSNRRYYTKDQIINEVWEDVDFTTSNIDGIEVRIQDIAGGIFSIEQAIDLSRLMKIIIK